MGVTPLALAAPTACLVGLFKPQFEVGRENIGKGGIVTDRAAADRAALGLEAWLLQQGWVVDGWIESPIAGSDGNRERLFLARRS